MKAHAKINLALVVGPTRPDGKHEVVTVLQRLELHDDVHVERTDTPGVDVVAGDLEDTLVTRALRDISAAAGVEPRWRARIEKGIPVAAGLGGGSADAAAALVLANELLPDPLPGARLHELAAQIGADVPFFLAHGAQLGAGDGSALERVDVPQNFTVVLLLPKGARKESTGAVYAAFDREAGFEKRAAQVRRALKEGDLAALPPNDLASSRLAFDLLELGAFRADVSGAGPALYGLFADPARARAAAAALERLGRTVVSSPTW